MFRSATTRIAHNSMVPGLAQAALSKDLKALQDLINAEKVVQQTLHKLGQDIGKASEAVKIWGNGEGDDLGDTLSACTALLLHYASALARFSSTEGTIREQMKAVRTREESLDELKKRRKSLMSKADAADKKLSKMSGENKNFQAQADSLNRLREDIRVIDTEILNEEASLGDFKRASAKNWMGLKFGALADCCEKGLIVSELGKLVIAEIPQLHTEPGLPRPYYNGHANTEALVAEGRRRIDQVVFSTEPNPSSLNIRQIPDADLPLVPTQGIVPRPNSSQLTFATAPGTPEPSGLPNRFSQVILSPAGTSFIQLPDVSLGSGSLGFSEAGNMPPQSPRSPPPPSVLSSQTEPYSHSVPQTPRTSNGDMAEFGVYQPSQYQHQPTQYAPRTSSLRNNGEMSPSAIPAGPRDSRFATVPNRLSGGMGPRPQPTAASSSLSSPRLDDRPPSIDIERPNVSFSSSIAEALGEQWSPSDPTGPHFQQQQVGPAPGSKAYEAKMHVRNRDYSPPPPQYTPVPEAPLGTIPEKQQGTSKENPFDDRQEAEDEEEGLAYLSSGHEERLAGASTSGHGHEDRRVRFGAANDDDSARDNASQTAPSMQEPEPPAATSSVPPVYPQPTHLPHTLTEHAAAPSTPPAPEIPPVSTAKTPEEEEKDLNAAAAREVSRELDALMFSSPLKPAEPVASRPDPLQVPAPPFARRFTPSRSSLSLGSDQLTSPTRTEASYVRERDRSPSVVASPTSATAHSPTSSVPSHSADGHDTAPLAPPPSISLPPRIPSPAPSSTSTTPFRTPMEFPGPAPPFYNLPAMSGSGSFQPGGTRTISAAAFKRQLRSPSSPPPDAQDPGTSPLIVKKRMPGSPLPPSARLQEPHGMQRVSSAPDPRNRVASATYGARPESTAGEEDHYDYISAYVDDPPPEHGQGNASGYGQGRFATNLDSDSIR